MKLLQIISAIEEFAPPALQEEYDNSGLITGNLTQEITQALLCLDVTELVIDEAIHSGCNLVIAHHPIIFSGLKKLTGSNYVERALVKAIKHDIAIYAVHTNLDNVRFGVNQKIAQKLQLINTRVLSPAGGKLMKLYTFAPHDHAATIREALFAAGAGVIGNYDECSFNAEGYGTFRGNDETNPYVGKQAIQHREPETKIEVVFPFWLKHKVVEALRQSHPYEEVAFDLVALENDWEQAGAGLIGDLPVGMQPDEFLQFLKEKLETGTIRFTSLEPSAGVSEIRTIALCGGSGSFLLQKAKNAGSHAFVTADFKYHQFFDAEGKIMVCDIGHYESEQFTPELIAEVLRRKFPTFATRFTSVVTNPINYY